MKHFAIMLISALLLSGCARQTPTSALIEHHVQLVNETIDYAQNNMADTTETKMLINSLKTCKSGLLDAERTYKGEIATCEAERKYWRSTAIGLFFALCVAIFVIIKRVF